MTITHQYRTTAFSLALLFSVGCTGGATLAKVGGESITESDLNVLAEVNPRLQPRLATPMGKQKILENYVEQTLLYREAKHRGLHRSGLTKKKLDLYNKVIIAQAVLDDEVEKKVKEYYENHRDEFERVKISHIQVKSEALAKQLKGQLDKGEDFVKLAEKHSEDSRTNKKQGDLGFITFKDRRLDHWGWLPLAEKAFAMEAGAVSDPIKTKDGYHLVKVTEARNLQPLAEAEAAIRFRLQTSVRQELLDGLKKKYKVAYTAKKEEAPNTPATPEPPTQPEPPHEHQGEEHPH